MFGFNELPTGVKAILALALVLALVLIAGLLLRSLAGGRLKLNSLANRPRQPRLGVVDMFDLDRQRQLILLRRDNVEHLVMIGGPNDVVIEASILRGTARAPAHPPAEPHDLHAAETPGEVQRRPQPLPESQPPQAAPAGPRGVAASVAAATSAAAATLGTALARPSRAEPTLEAVPAPAEPAPPPSAPRKVTVVTTPAPTPPPAAPQPDLPADDQIAAAFEAELARADMLASPRAPAPPPAKPIIEPIESPGHIKASRAEMEDMTRDLQEALRRPFSGVKPSAALAGAKIGGPRLAFPPDFGSPPSNAPDPTAAASRAAPEPPPSIAETYPSANVDADAGSTGAPPAIADEPAVADRDLLDAAPSAPEPEIRAEEAPAPAGEPAAVEPDAVVIEIERASAGPEAVDALPRPEEPAPSQPEPKTAAPAAVVETPATPVDMPPPQAPRAPAAMPPGFDSFESELAAILAVDLAKPAPAPAAGPAPEPEPRQDAVQPPAPPPSPPAEAAAPDAPASPPVRKPGGADDPFSVDAIEAEFARLLNRPLPPKS